MSKEDVKLNKFYEKTPTTLEEAEETTQAYFRGLLTDFFNIKEEMRAKWEKIRSLDADNRKHDNMVLARLLAQDKLKKEIRIYPNAGKPWFYSISPKRNHAICLHKPNLAYSMNLTDFLREINGVLTDNTQIKSITTIDGNPMSDTEALETLANLKDMCEVMNKYFMLKDGANLDDTKLLKLILGRYILSRTKCAYVDLESHNYYTYSSSGNMKNAPLEATLIFRTMSLESEMATSGYTWPAHEAASLSAKEVLKKQLYESAMLVHLEFDREKDHAFDVVKFSGTKSLMPDFWSYINKIGTAQFKDEMFAEFRTYALKAVDDAFLVTAFDEVI
jgi:hypothetical protein